MQLNISEFRRRVMSLIDDLPEEGVTIMKHGNPVAKLVPAQRQDKGRYITEPPLKGKGKPGPLAPTTKFPNGYDPLFD